MLVLRPNVFDCGRQSYQTVSMICAVALAVFSFAGIFSASHRETAKEAFECVSSRVRRQPCETGLDDRLQAQAVGKLLNHSPRLAGILNRHFEKFSWALLLVLLVSGGLAAESVFNLAVHGNCNGPTSTTGCTISKAGSGSAGLVETCMEMLREATG